MNPKLAALTAIDDAMSDELKLTYAYDGFPGVPTYPYFVGDYVEQGNSPSEGAWRGTFTIRGWHKGNAAELIKIEADIKAHLGHCARAVGGYCVATDIAGSQGAPNESPELKTIEIRLDVRVFGQ